MTTTKVVLATVVFSAALALGGSALAQTTAISGTVAPASYCTISNNLTRGASGNSVVALQTFLSSQGYFSSAPIGVFGPLTLRAVIAFQQANSLPTTGFFGPMSRAAMMRFCSPTPAPQNTSLSADPSAGAAPLAVSFSGTGLTGGSQYIIEYGDGQNSGPLSAIDVCMHLSDGSGGCPKVSASHTYSTNGTYEATLEGYIACMWSNPRCMIATIPLGKATITVGGSVSSQAPKMYSINPTSGPIGTTVTIAGSGFTANNIIHFGSGAISGVGAANVVFNCPMMPAGSTSSCGAYSQTLTFTVPSSAGPYCAPGTACPMYMMLITPGTYDMYVQNDNGNSNHVTFTVTGVQSSGAISINGLDAPSLLPVGVQGTWTVHVTSPSTNANLHYSVVWGDEAATAASNIMAPQPSTVQTSATFTHSYARTGSFTPVFTVTDDSGHSVSTSASVSITPIY